jgi:glycosyltransferase involved in cell wall biosynthesis
MNKTLTVFTPIFNRVSLIKNLYWSLKQQTSYDFIWLIVDDGSTDDIHQCVMEMIEDTEEFEIQYVYQENQGKHIAHNTGVDCTKTKLFMCVDSDDILTKDAVKSIIDVDSRYDEENVSGYLFRKQDTSGNISGGTFTIKNPYIGMYKLYSQKKFRGELAAVFRTEKIASCRFPKFGDEKFLSESVLYNQLERVAPMVWVDQVIYIFEYQSDGYTNSGIKLMINNPCGCAMRYLSDALTDTTVSGKIKNYALFRSMISLFNLSSSQYDVRSVNCLVRNISYILVPHYRHRLSMAIEKLK